MTALGRAEETGGQATNTTDSMKPQNLEELQKLRPDLLPEVIVNAVSKRVRQLNVGSRPLIHVEPKMTTIDVALREFSEEKISIELPPTPTGEDMEKKRKRRRK